MEPLYITAPHNAYRDLNQSRFSYCGNCNSFVPHSFRASHDSFHAHYTNRKDGNMSSVLWCDPGNHPFKAGERGSANFEGTQYDENNNPVHVTQDVCAKHNRFNATADIENALTAIEAE